MRQLFILLAFLFISSSIRSQERVIINIPDIPGYKTLICDFHLHTVFSDGLVWPTIRVDEAWREGLDAIAITDHLEYLPHKADIKADHNRSWQIAKEYASDKNVILIPGTEITKSMPPGHFNALFIKDANLIFNSDYKLAIGEAANQGAFIIWNHPGWKAQQPDTMKWWDDHTWLYDQGWMHGIEVVNDGEFYPEAINWAHDRNLTILGNSDQHAPFPGSASVAGSHRPCTFVFATERSSGGIREALFNGRTAAWNGKKVIGKSSLLKALFIESVSLKNIDENQHLYSFVNNSDLHFDLRITNSVYKDWQKTISLKPGYEFFFEIPAETLSEEIELMVVNFITGTDEVLRMPLSMVKNVLNK